MICMICSTNGDYRKYTFEYFKDAIAKFGLTESGTRAICIFDTEKMRVKYRTYDIDAHLIHFQKCLSPEIMNQLFTCLADTRYLPRPKKEINVKSVAISVME